MTGVASAAILSFLLALVSGLALVAVRTLVSSLQDDRNYLRSRVTDLERALASHTWQEYAALSNVPTPLARATNEPVNSWGEVGRTDEAYGSTEEDVLQNLLASHGVDLEGPTIG